MAGLIARQMMARLLPLIILILIPLLIAFASRQPSGERRAAGAYRPRRRTMGGAARRRANGSGEPFMVQEHELRGVRDAYSGADLDPGRPLVRCAQCLAFYHATSAQVLIRENQGRCPACGGNDFRAVTLRRR